MIRTDLSLHLAVREALRTELGAVATGIVVKAQDGVVGLSGVVRTAAQSLAAEHAVQSVSGVHAVVQQLRIQSDERAQETDQALAKRAVEALAAGKHPIGRDVLIEVENGWLTLRGTVDSEEEFCAVECVLECLSGLRGMTSEVQIATDGTEEGVDRVAPSTL